MSLELARSAEANPEAWLTFVREVLERLLVLAPRLELDNLGRHVTLEQPHAMNETKHVR
jgi:hypothetical protein